MAHFNTSVKKKVSVPDTINKGGTSAFSQSVKLEIASLLLTSFANDSYYEKAPDRFTRLEALISKDPNFSVKALIYARNEFEMRSITHVGAAVIAKHIAGFERSKDFYNMIVRRPDDMTEILACYLSLNQGKKRKLPNALRKGFAMAFNRFDNYQLAKYRGADKSVKLVDVVNLVHPTPNATNTDALKALIANTLRNTDTWESKLTAAGQLAKGEEELSGMKADVWESMLAENKLPYFALLRNLRNIHSQAPKAIPLACNALLNEGAVRKAKILPFRFISALKELAVIGDANARIIGAAIQKAIDISLGNMPSFDGTNLVVLDCSGSMFDKSRNGRMPMETGALFAACIAKKTNADCIVFGNTAQYVSPTLVDSLGSIAGFLGSRNMGGTDYRTWVTTMNKKYDRIFVLSDGEANRGIQAAEPLLKPYRVKYKANPFIFNFDLKGNGTMQFPEAKTFCLAGFGDKTMDLIGMLEQDKNALVHDIEKIEF